MREQRQKTEIAYDASSKKEGPSLNDCLEKGTNLLPEIINVLLRFRGYKIGLTSDIKKGIFEYWGPRAVSGCITLPLGK